MKVAAYVPIKMNSVRTPGKNIKKLADGTPLCKLLFQTLSEVPGIDERYCFCSDSDIRNYLVPGIEFLKRDATLDSEDTRCDEIIRSFVNIADPDIIVLTHVTSPFLSVDTLETCVKMVKTGRYDSAFTVSKLQEFMWKDGKPLNFDAAVTPRSQDLPVVYRETNGVFVFTRDLFETTNRRVGFKPFLYEVGFPEAMDINYPEDFLMADVVYMNDFCGRMRGIYDGKATDIGLHVERWWPSK